MHELFSVHTPSIHPFGVLMKNSVFFSFDIGIYIRLWFSVRTECNKMAITPFACIRIQLHLLDVRFDWKRQTLVAITKEERWANPQRRWEQHVATINPVLKTFYVLKKSKLYLSNKIYSQNEVDRMRSVNSCIHLSCGCHFQFQKKQIRH